MGAASVVGESVAGATVVGTDVVFVVVETGNVVGTNVVGAIVVGKSVGATVVGGEVAEEYIVAASVGTNVGTTVVVCVGAIVLVVGNGTGVVLGASVGTRNDVVIVDSSMDDATILVMGDAVGDAAVVVAGVDDEPVRTSTRLPPKINSKPVNNPTIKMRLAIVSMALSGVMYVCLYCEEDTCMDGCRHYHLHGMSADTNVRRRYSGTKPDSPNRCWAQRRNSPGEKTGKNDCSGVCVTNDLKSKKNTPIRYIVADSD